MIILELAEDSVYLQLSQPIKPYMMLYRTVKKTILSDYNHQLNVRHNILPINMTVEELANECR